MTRIARRRSRSFSSCESLEPRVLLAGDLVAHWLAQDLVATVGDGGEVVAWTDRIGQADAARSEGQPTLLHTSVGGRAAIRFDAADGADYLNVAAANNPMAGVGDFSIAVVFATSDTNQRSAGANWYQATGLVDSNRLGFAKDWGLSIDSSGNLRAGMSEGLLKPTATVTSTVAGLNDAQTHTAFFTRSGSNMSLYVDDAAAVTRTDGDAANRDATLEMVIGGLLSRDGAFTGEIAEVRVYNGQLSSGEVGTIRGEITSFYNNSAPIALNDTYTVAEDPLIGLIVPVASGVLANDSDADGDPLTAVVVDQPQHGTVSLKADGSFLYDPDKDFAGTDSFTYTAVDFRASNVATVEIIVTPVYDPAIANDDAYKTLPTNVLNIPSLVGLMVNDQNPDNANLTVVLDQNVGNGSLTLGGDGSFRYDPQGFSGNATFTYKLDDGTGLSQAATVTIVVNTAPVVVNDTISVNEDTVLMLSAANGPLKNDIDADGNSLTATLISDVSNGVLTLADDGSMTYTPNADFFGDDSFTYRVSDGVDQSGVGTVTLSVQPINDAPVAVADVYFGVGGASINIASDRGLLANDIDIDSTNLTAVKASDPQNGQLTLRADGSFEYVPNAEFEGVDSFTYQARDGQLTSATIDVSLFVGGSPLRINELMAANATLIETRLRAEPDDRFRGEVLTPDWIEIQNLTTADFDVSGFHLSDRENDLKQWQFPTGTSIPGGGSLIVYASRLNNLDPMLDETERLHTNFVLSVNGDYIGISDPEGNLLDGFNYPDQFADISYGIDSSGEFGHLLVATPGEENSAAYLGVSGDTSFSIDRGFYSAPFQVEITTDDVNAEIRYTFDGSQPTAENGISYTGPILIDRTSNLRAAAIKTDYITPNVDTHTYIFVDQVIQQTETPTTGPTGNTYEFPDRWRSQASDYEMDPNVTGDPQYRDQMTDALLALPSVALTVPIMFEPDGLYGNPQATAEHAASAELIFPDGRVGFQIDAGARMQGGASRAAEHLKHSMSIRFREDYGDTQLDFPLFEGSPVDTFESIHFRARYNNSWIHWDQGQRNRATMQREMWARDTMLAAGQVAAGHGEYVHMYLNGLYWGIYEMHERQDASHFANYYGGQSYEYDATNAAVSVDGNGESFANLRDVVRTRDWEEIQKVLDIDNHILFNIVQRYGGNQDLKSDGNWRTAGGGTANAPWQFYMWDVERILENPRQNQLGPVRDLLGLLNELVEIDEYKIQFADHLHRLMFNGGALTPEEAAGRWSFRADQLSLPIIAESARWGDARRDRGQRDAQTKELDWLPEQQRLLNDYFPVRTEFVIGLYENEGLYPDTDAPEFLVNNERQHGGPLGDADTLSIMNPNANGAGTIYVTLDGSDPRREGGAVSANATIYNGGAINLTGSTRVRVRILNGGEWSAITDATFVTDLPADASNLRITEVNYHPHDPLTNFGEPDVNTSSFEFVEVTNISNGPISLNGVEFQQRAVGNNAEGVIFVFGNQTLAPGENTIIAENIDAFVARYGNNVNIAIGNDGLVSPQGQWGGGRLSDNNEMLTIVDSSGQIIQQMTYNDGGSWPERADGIGSSLEVVDVNGDANDGRNWVASRIIGGTPGAVDLGSSPNIVINEILSNSDAPAIDQLELFNASGQAVDLSNWFLSDSPGNLTKHQVAAGTTIAAGSYLTLTETVFGFGFKGQGSDDALLVTGDQTGRPIAFVDAVSFDATEPGVALGRWPNASGELFPMTSNSFGAANAGPLAPAIAISEIHYNPAPGGASDELAFVEVFNTTGSPLDISGWALDKAVNFEFPANTSLAAAGSLVVVSFNPLVDSQAAARFQAQYGVASDLLVGPYGGVLDNGGERVELQSPIAVDGGTEFILVDRVRYNDDTPWPVQADGQGSSLQRVTPDGFGNDVANWLAAAPTPGIVTVGDRPGDFDGNGIVNAGDIDLFCAQHQGNPEFDLDGNGVANNDDYLFLIRNILRTDLGDSDLDGKFGSRDLVRIFQAGEYEDGIAGNSTWAEGDWNCDGEFGTGDLTAAFQTGSYQALARPTSTDAFDEKNEVAASIGNNGDAPAGRVPPEEGEDRKLDKQQRRMRELDLQAHDLLFMDNVA